MPSTLSVSSTHGPIISLQGVFKQFQVGPQQVPVLRGISMEVLPGEFLLLHGPSGSGKSTLLHTLLGLEKPTTGSVEVLGSNLYQMSEDDVAYFNKEHLGMVHQQPYWIASLNVLENVTFPLMLKRIGLAERTAKAREMLEMVQMHDWASFRPSELSSGQQQRVSLARALISNPTIIVADEPTGNLDYESGIQLMEILKAVNRDLGKTVLMVTHDLGYMKYATRTIRMSDGKIVEARDEQGPLKAPHDKRQQPG